MPAPRWRLCEPKRAFAVAAAYKDLLAAAERKDFGAAPVLTPKGFARALEALDSAALTRPVVAALQARDAAGRLVLLPTEAERERMGRFDVKVRLLPDSVKLDYYK